VDLDTRISLFKLEVLCAVVDTGGVCRAADKLFLTQSVVTGHIHSLEQRLGAKLFEKAGRGIVPTETGYAVYSWAKDMLDRSRAMAREVEGIAAGTIGSTVIATGMTAGTNVLPPVLGEFYSANRAAHITLQQTTQHLALVAVRTGQADFAVVIGEQQDLDPGTLECERLSDLELTQRPRRRSARGDSDHRPYPVGAAAARMARQ
jgi:DNA-binding transcriptional LysR family regulator